MSKKPVSHTLDALPPLTVAQKQHLEDLAALPDHTGDMPELIVAQLSEMKPAALYRPFKKQITARVDADVLAWLKSQGKGYQSRMNAILRREMLAARTEVLDVVSGPLPHKTASHRLSSAENGTGVQVGGEAGNKFAGQKDKDVSGALILISASPLQHPALLQYLQKRKIDTDIVSKYLSQIEYKPPQSAKNCFALGYPAGDGFEARSAHFKGFVGIGKDVTFHKCTNQTKLVIFEGFMDFLSYLTMKNLTEPDGDALVLNSTALKTRALPYLENPQYQEIQLFLGNDEPGNICAAYFLDTAKTANITDMRSHYPKHNDLNEWHCDRNQ